MEQRCCQPRLPTGQDAGFTLIETVVVIVIMGVIAAAVVVNWASFTRHQDLRADAIAMHKEIVALKALAIGNGHADTLRCNNVDSCWLQWATPNENDDNYTGQIRPLFKLRNGVVINVQNADPALGELPSTTTTNYWEGGVTRVKIVAIPDNIRAYDSVWGNVNFPTGTNRATLGGWVVLSSAKVKARYRIQKDPNGIRPELYYQSNTGKPWKKM